MSGRIPWPCSACGAPGVRNLGTQGYCASHLSAFYAKISAEAWDGRGVGLLAGRHRPDHGPEFFDLCCSSCSATWVGALFEPCSWCERHLVRQREHQADLLLTPLLPDVDDARYTTAVKAWAERLARGVEAGIVTEHEARRVLHRRGVRDVAA